MQTTYAKSRIFKKFNIIERDSIKYPLTSSKPISHGIQEQLVSKGNVIVMRIGIAMNVEYIRGVCTAVL